MITIGVNQLTYYWLYGVYNMSGFSISRSSLRNGNQFQVPIGENIFWSIVSKLTVLEVFESPVAAANDLTYQSNFGYRD